MLLGWNLLLPALAGAEEDPSVIEARAWLLLDATTGQVLLAHEGERQLPIASTTKIMTAILAIERGKLDDLVTAGEKPYNTGGTTMLLELGEQQRLENLLYALMLESANDAAVAIAEHLAGSEERFAEWMNEKARSLGATGTHFVNSHGLHDPAHYSTARDLALIARYAMQNPTFRALSVVEEKEIPGAPGNPVRKLVNRNRLLGYYEGANGVKNGFTEEALLTNVASARRGETELIAVVLGAEWKLWTSSMALLDFGFERYETRRLATRGDLRSVELPEVGRVQLAHETDRLVTLRKEPVASQSEEITVPSDLTFPIEPGRPVAGVRFLLNGQLVSEGQLVATQRLELATPVVAPQAAERRVEERPPVQPNLWVALWLLGSFLLTMHLHRLRVN